MQSQNSQNITPQLPLKELEPANSSPKLQEVPDQLHTEKAEEKTKPKKDASALEEKGELKEEKKSHTEANTKPTNESNALREEVRSHVVQTTPKIESSPELQQIIKDLKDDLSKQSRDEFLKLKEHLENESKDALKSQLKQLKDEFELKKESLKRGLVSEILPEMKKELSPKLKEELFPELMNELKGIYFKELLKPTVFILISTILISVFLIVYLGFNFQQTSIAEDNSPRITEKSGNHGIEVPVVPPPPPKQRQKAFYFIYKKDTIPDSDLRSGFESALHKRIESDDVLLKETTMEELINDASIAGKKLTIAHYLTSKREEEPLKNLANDLNFDPLKERFSEIEVVMMKSAYACEDVPMQARDFVSGIPVTTRGWVSSNSLVC